MAEKERNGDVAPDDLDRRRLLAGGVVAAATAALPGIAKAQVNAGKSKDISGASDSLIEETGSYRFTAAMPEYQDYYDEFAKKHFGHENIVATVKKLKRRLFSEKNLVWGSYQKFAPDDPKDIGEWGAKGARRYVLWESAVAHAREDLAKIPAPGAGYGPDPDNPNDTKTTLLEHLDAAVRIALFKKRMPSESDPSVPNADPGFPIVVKVGFTTALLDRRHAVTTEWTVDPKQENCKLTIKMTCPVSGWLGTALGTGYDPISNGVVSSFRATYTVPKQPADKEDQILFIFNGLESLPGYGAPPGILQPVLQWTKKGKWAVRSWYVPASYYPDFKDMPENTTEMPFTDAKTVAFTKAEDVDVDDVLTGEITVVDQDTGAYRARFFLNGDEGNPIAQLDVNGIAPLTYPVAVIEGYRKSRVPLTRRHLVNVQMHDVALAGALSGAILPDWNLGREKDLSNGIEMGTNKLKAYRVTAIYDANANSSSLAFERK